MSFLIIIAFTVINGVSAESVYLTNGSDNIPKEIKVTFNETVNITENSTIELKDSTGTKIPISTWINDSVLKITPLKSLMAGVTYTLFLNNITDISGNEMGFYSSNFTVRPMKGYWMHYGDVAGVSASDLLSKHITDVFVLSRGSNGVTHNVELLSAISKFSPAGINVHAWIVCFKTGSPSYFVSPSGYFAKSVYDKTIRYEEWKKIAYKAKKKVKWKKVRGKWKYTYKTVIKYKWKKGWIYKPVYKTVSGYDYTYRNNLLSYIQTTSNYADLKGIHLDYIRYSGVASKGHAAWQEHGGVPSAVNAVTGFVQQTRSKIKPSAELSAAVMPEGRINGDLYGQDYSKLADYVDFLVPMTYEGNYHANNTWITDSITYIVNHAKGKPVYAGFTTYQSDDDVNRPADDIDAEVQSAKLGGAAGFVLFRYGTAGYENVPAW